MGAPEIRMSKPLEPEKPGLDSQTEHTDTGTNGPDASHQNPQNKASSFSLSPTGPSTKVRAWGMVGKVPGAGPHPYFPAWPWLCPDSQQTLPSPQLPEQERPGEEGDGEDCRWSGQGPSRRGELREVED
uniref:Uncharacterized protein n=1 Tax=Sarcophilus harrisii TaxID=9305 RepID=A0A7N4NW59_SARHA